jgi:putative transposase
LRRFLNLRKACTKRGDSMHLAGHYYHVYNRGCNRQPIFANAGNYLFLLRRAKSYLTDAPLSVIAYCLMPNHYHFLLRPEQDDALSPFIQRLFNSYTQAFNKQQGRSGTLFEGRAQSIPVDTEQYVIHLCRYIHLNPVKAGLVSHPADWPYSNYQEWVGRRDGALVDRQFVQQYFPTAADYEAFVTSEIEPSLEQKLLAYYLD